MTTHRHALVIGKFYPPHRGHHDLIRRAALEAARVTVLVLGSSFDSIPTAERVAWLNIEHAADPTVTAVGVRCDAPVNIHDETVWAAQVGVMRAGARQATAEPVDLVASGEVYGDELARRFSADHFKVDRTLDPINATAIRRDIPGHWDALVASVRAGLTSRVIVIGSGSTGTTTLAHDLAGAFRNRDGVWRRTQLVSEPGQVDAALGAGSPLLICDGDVFATADDQRRDLYLLTDHAGVDQSVKAPTDALTRQTALEDQLTAAGHSWFPVTGTREARRNIAVDAVDALITRRLTFAQPVRGPGFEPTSLPNGRDRTM